MIYTDLTVNGFEGKWNATAEISGNGTSVLLLEKQSHAVTTLMLAKFSGASAERIAGPFSRKQVLDDATAVVTGNIPQGTVLTAMQGMAAALIFLDLSVKEFDHLLPSTKH